MKAQSVSMFKRRMEKKLGERREKGGAMHRLVVSFWGLFYSDIRRAYAFVLYGRRLSGGPPPEKFWKNICRIVIFWTNLDEKFCLQNSSFS